MSDLPDLPRQRTPLEDSVCVLIDYPSFERLEHLVEVARYGMEGPTGDRRVVEAVASFVADLRRQLGMMPRSVDR